jgi:hypothetical protein
VKFFSELAGREIPKFEIPTSGPPIYELKKALRPRAPGGMPDYMERGARA